MDRMDDGGVAVRDGWRRRLGGAALAFLIGLLAAPGDARAAIAFVKNVGVAGDRTSSSSTSVVVPAGGVAVGNTVLVAFSTDPALGGTVACSDSQGNPYTTDADEATGSLADGIRTVICSGRITTALVAGNTITVNHPLAVAKG